MSNKINLLKSGTIFIVSLLCMQIAVAQRLPKAGSWQGDLQLNDSTHLPFSFKVISVNRNLSIEIMNGEERIKVDEISFSGDSMVIKMPVFDSEFRVKLAGDSLMKGTWINHARRDKNVIPFKANYCANHCDSKIIICSHSLFIDGIWECDFSPGSPNSSKAKGVFVQSDQLKCNGTFMTETGDYRYLEGISTCNKFYLSCFDGAHAFLFTGKIKGDSIVDGHFYSGTHWHEPWVAKRNDKFELRNPDSLTYLKPGYSKIDFNFKNLEGKNVSLADDKFKNKVVIIQLMGTWCPNCMDETKFLASFYDKYKSKGLEVVALAFERTDDFAKAVSNIQRSKTKFNAKYEFLITGKSGAQQASDALPMLNKVMAFPTTIYIDRKGVVRKIYTGFYGPATGAEYEKYVEETTRFVEKLLNE